MLGKPEWFKRRKYGGWGIYPKTWQGWVYIAAIMAPFMIFHSIYEWSETVRISGTVVWIVLVMADTIDIMLRMKKDERETMHEAISDRNASWAMALILAIGLLVEMVYQTIQGLVPTVNYVVVAALLGGVLTKAISNIYLDRKD